MDFKRFIKEYLKEFKIMMIITIPTLIIWRILERMILGDVNPNLVDTIVGLVLITSMYINVKQYQQIKEMKDYFYKDNNEI